MEYPQATHFPEARTRSEPSSPNLNPWSWREIKVEQADRHHLISIGKMSLEAQKRLRKILPEMDELFSLRLSGKGRIFGILQERGAMLVVWWDPGHEVCPVRR